jgi:hypothetical protein
MKLSQLPSMLQVAKAIKILAKYSSNGGIDADHDETWVGDDEEHHPEKISPEDRKRLKRCGFSWDKEVARWHRFV